MKTRIILLFTLFLMVNMLLIAQAPDWQWATQAGGSNSDTGFSISVDANGNSYVSGYFKETATFGAFTLTSSGSRDVFVAKFDTDGNWQWAKQAGGSSSDKGWEISVDANGNSYVTGNFAETATFGAFTLTSSGMLDWDVFVAKLDTDGNWQWAKQAGGSSTDEGLSIIVDANGNSYVAGGFQETATFGATTLTSSGVYDVFVAKLDTDGNWQWAEQAGGSGYDFGRCISVDANGNSYVTGFFVETATFGAFTLTSSGGSDVFVAKLNCTLSAENEISLTINSLSNFPNPFNPTTTLSFSIIEDSNIELSIYNIKGQKVKQLVNDQLSAGEHSIVWDGKDDNNQPVSSGIYFYKLKVNNKNITIKKCLLLK